MLPQEGCGGIVPNPKKLKEASVNIAQDKARLVWTMVGASALGKMCRQIIWLCAAPMVRAASTYSNSLIPSTDPRTTRAKIGK